MPENWRKFANLPPHEKRLLVQAAALLMLAPYVLQLLGVRRTIRWLASLARDAELALDVDDQVSRTARLVELASRHGPPRTCLHRAIVLWWMVLREGICCELRLGARLQNGRFQAHAWIEHRGRRVTNDDQFVPFGRALAVGSVI